MPPSGWLSSVQARITPAWVSQQVVACDPRVKRGGHTRYEQDHRLPVLPPVVRPQASSLVDVDHARLLSSQRPKSISQAPSVLYVKSGQFRQRLPELLTSFVAVRR
jgi:hypothetical protein